MLDSSHCFGFLTWFDFCWQQKRESRVFLTVQDVYWHSLDIKTPPSIETWELRQIISANFLKNGTNCVKRPAEGEGTSFFYRRHISWWNLVNLEGAAPTEDTICHVGVFFNVKRNLYFFNIYYAMNSWGIVSSSSGFLPSFLTKYASLRGAG